MMMPWKRRGERGGRGKKGIYIYKKSTGLAHSCLQVLFLSDNTRCCYMLVHIIHALIRARTYSTYARAHPRENAHAHAHDAFERARTDTHAPWHVWADHARTHAPVHEHVCMHAHAHALCTHAGTCMHAPAECTCMHTYAHAQTHLHMRTHSCKHTPTYFGCVLTDWGHTPQL